MIVIVLEKSSVNYRYLEVSKLALESETLEEMVYCVRGYDNVVLSVIIRGRNALRGCGTVLKLY